MNAKKARAATKKAESNAWAANRRQQEAEAKKQKAEDARALREDWPKFWRRVLKAIRDAANHQETKCTVGYGSVALAEKAEKQLLKKGYAVSYGHTAGYNDYGDFNAPCNVWEESSWLNIDW